ncbi:MAG: lipoyl(octanoyl) transferase LipB [Saprospiraceae bacterium]|nr:lipoyl(octanoyl) transferase LipB [Saprospiraceae bacterium]
MDNQRNLTKKLQILDLGEQPYSNVWALQSELHQNLIAQKREDPAGLHFTSHALILCEHPHVFTLGKSGQQDHLLQPLDKMEEINAEFHMINRGGDITYHGPGQLVAYPILDLEKIFTDVHKYIRSLEEVVILVLKEYGIAADRISGLTGVWIDIHGTKPRKICAIGVHLSRWVSLHGLAFNVNTDLDYFKYIVPCGINVEEKPVTSLKKELGFPVSMEDVKSKFIQHFLNTFELYIT